MRPVIRPSLPAEYFCLVSPEIAGSSLNIGMPPFAENASRLVILRPFVLFPLVVNFAWVTTCYAYIDVDS